MKPKVVIGLSGGVDSSVVAYLLKQKGYDVYGLSLKLWAETKKPFEKAKQVADFLGIKFFTKDVSQEFEQKIIKDFIVKYQSGKTPSPCTVCNREMKWHHLLKFANQNNIDYISSGHYINILNKSGTFYVQKAIDPIKDQSYFLWELTQDILKQMITPLGQYTKNQVREIAENIGLNIIIEPKESMSVCFLEKKNYRDFLLERKVKINNRGEVLNSQGEVIGSHKGVAHYTVGQKSDLDINIPGKFYVKKILPETNQIIVANKQELNVNELTLTDYYFTDIKDVERYNGKINVKIRGYGLNPEKYCNITIIDNKTLKVRLSDEAWAPAPGQPVVFYKDDILLGGGLTV